MMGSGKTTIGKILAARFNVNFIDTDAMVVKSAGLPISEIFATAGEAHFRKLEQIAVLAAISESPSIISTGGGCVVTPEVLQALQSSTHMVWLRLTPQQAYERIKEDQGRPLLQTANPLQKFTDLLAAREGYYAHAHITADAGGNDPQKTANAIIEALSPDLN
jgi:shikimate kinase